MAQRRHAYIEFSGTIQQEGDYWITYCDQLSLASCGHSPSEAKVNISNALKAFMKTLAETGELDAAMKRYGLKWQEESTSPKNAEKTFRTTLSVPELC